MDATTDNLRLSSQIQVLLVEISNYDNYHHIARLATTVEAATLSKEKRKLSTAGIFLLLYLLVNKADSTRLVGSSFSFFARTISIVCDTISTESMSPNNNNSTMYNVSVLGFGGRAPSQVSE